MYVFVPEWKWRCLRTHRWRNCMFALDFATKPHSNCELLVLLLLSLPSLFPVSSSTRYLHTEMELPRSIVMYTPSPLADLYVIISLQICTSFSCTFPFSYLFFLRDAWWQCCIPLLLAPFSCSLFSPPLFMCIISAYQREEKFPSMAWSPAISSCTYD